MGIINSLEEYTPFTEKLNVDILRDSEPDLLFHFIQTLTEKETDLLRKAYYSDIKKSFMDWRERENKFAINRLLKYGMIKSYIDDNGKGYKFTRHGKKIAKLLVEDYFPNETYPTQQRAVTPGRIYREYLLKTYYNRRPVTSNSIPTEKIGSYEFTTQLIEFNDIIIADGEEVGKIKNIAFKETKATRILKEKIEKGLALFNNSKNTRIMRPILYNRRSDEVIFLVAFGGQTLYMRTNNVYLSYLKHRYGEDIKFLVNTNHLNKVSNMVNENPAMPIMVIGEDGEPIALLGNESYLVKDSKQIKEIITNFYRSHDFSDEE